MDLTLNKVLDVQYAPVQWLASRFGTETCRTITLDVSTFTANTHYPNGRLLSGLILGKITASGKYGLYNSAASDGRQTAAGILYDDPWVSWTGGHRNAGSTVNTAVPITGALMWQGVVKTAALTTIWGGTLPAGALTDLAGKFRFE